MDSYEFHAIKIEKAKAIQRYRTFNKIATIVRSLEIFAVVILISWSVFRSSAYLPVAINFSGAFFRRVCNLFFCPHFVFLLGNAIIITLFANSREKTSTEKSVGDDIFSVSAADSISAEKTGGGGRVFSGESHVEEREPEVAKAVVYVPPPAAETVTVEVAEKREPEVEVKAVEEERRTYRRSKSAVEKVIAEEEKIELRRSRTVPRRKSGEGDAAMAARRRRRMSDMDDLSIEEFNRRVAAFIEKQQQFRREESQALVLTN